MVFYRLDYPEYISDMEHSRKNPVEWANRYIVPGLICPECGTWSRNRRLFLPVDDINVKNFLKLPPYPLPLEEWKRLASRIIGSIPTGSDYDSQPGDELGDPTAKINSTRVSDFLFPWGGGILVTQKTMDIIITSELTGCQFLRIDLVDKRSKKSRENPLPCLYVLIVTGRFNPLTNMDRCPKCGRLIDSFPVNLSQRFWDGNDFVVDENYQKIVYVTEKAYAVFEQYELTNYQCRPIMGEE